MSYKIIDSLHHDIGKTIASERFLNTMDGFWFALKPNVIINSFDFVTVDNLFNSKSIGIIKELQAVTAEHDYYNNYLSDNHTISSTKKQLKQKGKEKEELELILQEALQLKLNEKITKLIKDKLKGLTERLDKIQKDKGYYANFVQDPNTGFSDHFPIKCIIDIN